jgi:hypothetical protein
MVIVGILERFGYLASSSLLFWLLSSPTIALALDNNGPAGSRLAQAAAVETLPRRPAPTEAAICADFSTPAGNERYCVSSVLPRDSKVNQFYYGPDKLFDHEDKTAWVEGVDGQGIGEWIVVEFDRLRVVKEIQINNGYNKDGDLYRKNSRVKEMKVEFSERERRKVVLKDTGTPQPVALPKDQPLKAHWIRFTIESVYPGDKWDDTAISELHIVSEPIRP